jgi:hypothetical protein
VCDLYTGIHRNEKTACPKQLVKEAMDGKQRKLSLFPAKGGIRRASAVRRASASFFTPKPALRRDSQIMSAGREGMSTYVSKAIKGVLNIKPEDTASVYDSVQSLLMRLQLNQLELAFLSNRGGGGIRSNSATVFGYIRPACSSMPAACL